MIGVLTSAMLGMALPPLETASAVQAERYPTEIVADYVEAYNARDLEAMRALMHPDIQWLSVDGESIVIVADGEIDLSAQMQAYMEGSFVTTSEIAGEIVDGGFVAVREISSWAGADGAERSQSALAVYEVDGGTVRRVWYYPSTR